MGWRLRLSDKTVRKFAKLPIYCHRQKCRPGNVVSGSIRLIQILGRGAKWQWGRWKLRFSLLSFTVFRTFYIHGHTTAFTWCDCRWPWRYFKVIRLFHIKLLKNGAWYGKSYYRLLIGNYTLAFDWCHFWWPWITFDGHFSLGSHFHVHFSNLWPAFASRGLPAIAELVVLVTFSWSSYSNGKRCQMSNINSNYKSLADPDFLRAYIALIFYSEFKYFKIYT